VTIADQLTDLEKWRNGNKALVNGGASGKMISKGNGTRQNSSGEEEVRAAGDGRRAGGPSNLKGGTLPWRSSGGASAQEP